MRRNIDAKLADITSREARAMAEFFLATRNGAAAPEAAVAALEKLATDADRMRTRRGKL
jgi:hypothetical protein